MASIRAVLERYDLDDGDVILVDTGRYLLTTNISIGAQDSGVVIRGAMGERPYHTARSRQHHQYVAISSSSPAPTTSRWTTWR